MNLLAESSTPIATEVTANPPAVQPYVNRELSLLEFNRRVLEQAKDESVPLLERLKFLCISCSNLDEFFEIRVAGLKQMIKLGTPLVGQDGITPTELFAEVSSRAHTLVDEQYR